LLSPVQEVLMAAGELHADGADSDVGLVRRLLAAQFPQWAARPIERVPSAGTDHALYRLGDDQVVRLPLAWRAAKGLDKELTWLPRLAPLLPVAIPVVLGTGLPAEGYPLPWAVYRWLDGENPRIDHIADTDVLATDLAAFIAALQRVDLADGPTAVLDFSTVGVGDPACDLIVGWFLLPAPAREAFRAAVHVDDATWARGRGWALALALGQVAYFRDTNPVIVADARQVIRAVLTDHLPHLQRSNSNQTP
jgi:aminoglycoside phosphotransferase (APT) family kinase protein